MTVSPLPCVLCSAVTPGPLPYGLDEGWAALKDCWGTWQAVCPEHREAVAWASMRSARVACDVCGRAVMYETRWPEAVVAPPGWHVRIDRGERTTLCPNHQHQGDD
jgi:hypothetical protein